jgi:hypothetical protein
MIDIKPILEQIFEHVNGKPAFTVKSNNLLPMPLKKSMAVLQQAGKEFSTDSNMGEEWRVVYAIYYENLNILSLANEIYGPWQDFFIKKIRTNAKIS